MPMFSASFDRKLMIRPQGDTAMNDRYDAIIVGARVAGASTAMLLARAGLRVLVIDRARHGTDTLSTHAFMRGGVMQLSRFGLLDEVIAAGTPPVHRTVIRYGDTEETVDIRPGPYVPALFAPRRNLLDRILVDAAVRAGADVRFQTALTGLLRDDDGRVIGVEARGPSGHRLVARAPLTIGADGLRSRVAREVGALTYESGTNASAMVVGYWSGVQVEGYQWLYGTGMSAGIIPTNDGQVCVWAGTPSSGFERQRREPDLGIHRILRTVAPDWSQALSRGHQHGPVRGFPGVQGFLRQPWGRGWALVGDASHFKDPLTTHGMTDALRDAELLARAVLGSAEGTDDLDHALAGYQDLRDALAHELLLLSDRAAAYDWDMARLRELLLAVSRTMRPELQYLLELDATSTPEGHSMRPLAVEPTVSAAAHPVPR
jgi:flavin-dependent dehydrogenase